MNFAVELAGGRKLNISKPKKDKKNRGLGARKKTYFDEDLACSTIFYKIFE